MVIEPSADRPGAPDDRDSLTDARGRSSHRLTEAAAVVGGMCTSQYLMAGGMSHWLAIGVGAGETATFVVVAQASRGLELLTAKVRRFMRS